MSLWIVDEQPAKRLGLSGEAIVDRIRAAGHECVQTFYDAASNSFPLELEPVFESNQPVILRGSVGFAAWAHDNWRIEPGAFRSPRLGAAAWLPVYGALALNRDHLIVRYGEFEARRGEFEKQFGGALFVKPADASKLLCGTVLEPSRPLFDAHYSAHRKWTEPPPDYRVLIARTQKILAEYRFVVAGEQVVAGSVYKIGSTLWSNSDQPPAAAFALAQKIARHAWRPAAVFVVDAAETEDGFRLLELNAFGTSGLYDCDLDAVVRAVSQYAV